jgi:hypothetical protein
MLTEVLIRNAKPKERAYTVFGGTSLGLCPEAAPSGSKRRRILHWRSTDRLRNSPEALDYGKPG